MVLSLTHGIVISTYYMRIERAVYNHTLNLTSRTTYRERLRVEFLVQLDATKSQGTEQNLNG